MSSLTHGDLKRLQTQKHQLALDLKSAKEQKKEAQESVDTLEKRNKELSEKISCLTRRSEKLVFSEHAILRYFERVLGYDIEEIKRKIVPEKIEEQIKQVGGGLFPVHVEGNFPDESTGRIAFRKKCSHKVRVKKNKVITIVTKD